MEPAVVLLFQFDTQGPWQVVRLLGVFSAADREQANALATAAADRIGLPPEQLRYVDAGQGIQNRPIVSFPRRPEVPP